MIKFEELEVVGWRHAIRGMRNPLNSWDKSDSDYRRFLGHKCEECGKYELPDDDSCDECWINHYVFPHKGFTVGPNDLTLMKKLRKGGPDHGKFMRMIVVYVDITAPLYWWKEFDTYKVGTVANSCSTMHKIHDKEFTMDDFSHEHMKPASRMTLEENIDLLNYWRDCYNAHKGSPDIQKEYWWQMIQLLGTSYNQKRTVMLNYEVLTNIYKARRHHKLDEWHAFCDLIETLPYSELITGPDEETSFQEDLDFFVNDCTDAQLEALYKEVEKKLKEKGLVNV